MLLLIQTWVVLFRLPWIVRLSARLSARLNEGVQIVWKRGCLEGFNFSPNRVAETCTVWAEVACMACKLYLTLIILIAFVLCSDRPLVDVETNSIDSKSMPMPCKPLFLQLSL